MMPSAMTYEDKLLAVFARFRGEAMDSGTLEQLERACNAEVWRHLPLDVRSSWRLHLAFSDETHGQIELRPHQLRADGATPAQLEAALRSPFREEEPALGGFVTSFNFDAAPSNSPRPTSANSPVKEPAHSGRTVPELVAPASKVVAPASKVEAHPERALDARTISAQAEALGISLPPNSALLGPFLEALSLATHYRERAERAESDLANLLARLESVSSA